MFRLYRHLGLKFQTVSFLIRKEENEAAMGRAGMRWGRAGTGWDAAQATPTQLADAEWRPWLTVSDASEAPFVRWWVGAEKSRSFEGRNYSRLACKMACLLALSGTAARALECAARRELPTRPVRPHGGDHTEGGSNTHTVRSGSWG